jgi:hypothetical protein
MPVKINHQKFVKSIDGLEMILESAKDDEEKNMTINSLLLYAKQEKGWDGDLNSLSNKLKLDIKARAMEIINKVPLGPEPDETEKYVNKALSQEEIEEAIKDVSNGI